jgi:chloramphenicol 3-O-phosphotransferase
MERNLLIRNILVRADGGLNILITEDAQNRVGMPEGVRHARTLDLNIHYIDCPGQPGTARSVSRSDRMGWMLRF